MPYDPHDPAEVREHLSPSDRAEWDRLAEWHKQVTEPQPEEGP